MSGRNGSLSPKPWWKSRREHSAAGDGGIVLAYCDRVTSVSEAGAHLIDSVTLGFRTKSYSAILDPSRVRSRALFLLLAGLSLADSGRVTVKLPASARKAGRTVSVSLIHEHSPMDPTMTVNQNLILPLAETGTFASHGQFHAALAVTGLKDRAAIPVSELSALDRFRLAIARAIVGGGDLILVEDPRHLRNAQDRRQALDLLPILASHGSAVVLATADPAAAAQAGRAILLTNGRLSGDFVQPKEEELRQALGDGIEDPATLLGPIPLARIEDEDSTPAPSASLFPTEDESPIIEVDQGTHTRELAFFEALERGETAPQETLEALETLETVEESQTKAGSGEVATRGTTPGQTATHEKTPGEATTCGATPGETSDPDTAQTQTQGEDATALPPVSSSSTTPLRRRPNFHPLTPTTLTPAEQTLAHMTEQESLPRDGEQASETPHEDSADANTSLDDTAPDDTAPFVSLSPSEVVGIPQPQEIPTRSAISEAVQLCATPVESATPGSAQPAICPSESENPSQSDETPAEAHEPTQPTTAHSDARRFETLEASAPSSTPHESGGRREEATSSSSQNVLPSADQFPVLDDESDPITRVIRTLGLHDVSARHARPRENEARITHLPQSAPVPLAPTPETAAVIDKARRILKDLPGPVVPEE